MIAAASALLGLVLIIGALWYGGGVVALVVGLVAAAFGLIRFAFLMTAGEHRPP